MNCIMKYSHLNKTQINIPRHRIRETIWNRIFLTFILSPEVSHITKGCKFQKFCFEKLKFSTRLYKHFWSLYQSVTWFVRTLRNCGTTMEGLDNSSPTSSIAWCDIYEAHKYTRPNYMYKTKHLRLTKSVPTKMQNEVEIMISKRKCTVYIEVLKIKH